MIYHSREEYEVAMRGGVQEKYFNMEVSKYYEEKIKILEKQVKTLKRNLREISEVVKEQYDNMPFPILDSLCTTLKNMIDNNQDEI